jgi:hypothetical protein
MKFLKIILSPFIELIFFLKLIVKKFILIFDSEEIISIVDYESTLKKIKSS